MNAVRRVIAWLRQLWVTLRGHSQHAAKVFLRPAFRGTSDRVVPLRPNGPDWAERREGESFKAYRKRRARHNAWFRSQARARLGRV